MAEGDTHNFSSSSSPSHRLPTYSASQALDKLASISSKPISTNIRTLNLLLQGQDVQERDSGVAAGISRGQTTEIYGPPGVGKTALGLQLAANELREQRSVVWVDAARQFPIHRLSCFLFIDAGTESQSSTPSPQEHFHHYQCPTLPHLLALLTRPSDAIPDKVGLLVIDGFSTLFNLAYPKRYESSTETSAAPRKRDSAQWASGRRWAVLSDLIAQLNTLAVTSNIAVVVLNQTTTRIRQGGGAHLYPALSGSIWENAIANRVALFRDWLLQQGDGPYPRPTGSVRFAAVVKAKGMPQDGFGIIASFAIMQNELRGVETPVADFPAAVTLKRKWDEIADNDSGAGEAEVSEDEFGWANEDDVAPDELLALQADVTDSGH